MGVNWSIKETYKFTKGFQIILKFYLIECPIEGVSRRSGLAGNLEGRARKLRKAMLECSNMTAESWKVVPADSMEETLSSMGVLRSFRLPCEFAIHAQRHQTNYPLSLVYMIRCALAHGSFSQRTCNGETYYSFESSYGGKLKGRAVLCESTLLKWVDLMTSDVVRFR